MTTAYAPSSSGESINSTPIPSLEVAIANATPRPQPLGDEFTLVVDCADYAENWTDKRTGEELGHGYRLLGWLHEDKAVPLEFLCCLDRLQLRVGKRYLLGRVVFHRYCFSDHPTDCRVTLIFQPESPATAPVAV